MSLGHEIEIMTAPDNDMPARDCVSLTVRDGAATILFDCASRRNAMPLRTWQALPSLVAAAEGDASAKLIIVRGAGGHFGAGNDISEFGALAGNPVGAKAYGLAMAEAMQAIETASKPVVMAIEGMCYGASVALALAGDLRLAADEAVFAITPAKLGALYLQSDLHRLAAAVGAGQAKALIYTARSIGAVQARAIGLVDEVAPPGGFDDALERLTADILCGSPFTLRRSKAMLGRAGHGPAPAETEDTLALFVEATQGPDFKEGVEAFREKRPPRFR